MNLKKTKAKGVTSQPTPALSPEVQERIPYFDGLIEKLDSGDSETEKTFGLNVHWGYWENPKSGDGSVDDFASASRNMTRKVYASADIKEGMRVLDVGCGFGGTVYELNESFSNLDLVGLNIDPRQLVRARKLVQRKKKNRVSFVQGNACQLPFPDQSFDVVLAVECIFHFPSRIKFFKEAHRVLKKGGRLVVSDSVVYGPLAGVLAITALPFHRALSDLYGARNTVATRSWYRVISKLAGFQRMQTRDITANTLPTFRVLKKLEIDQRLGFGPMASSLKANRYLEFASRAKLLRYSVMDFAKR